MAAAAAAAPAPFTSASPLPIPAAPPLSGSTGEPLVTLRLLESTKIYSVNRFQNKRNSSSSSSFFLIIPQNHLMDVSLSLISSFFRCFVPEEEKESGVESPLCR
jgi:hypothetical protein